METAIVREAIIGIPTAAETAGEIIMAAAVADLGDLVTEAAVVVETVADDVAATAR